jgi:hypothetical protein
MPQSPLNRLKALEKSHTRERRIYPLWVDARDTPGDIAAKRNRLIAGGRASADDEFVQIRWKRRGEA